jgi:hypothetical protein
LCYADVWQCGKRLVFVYLFTSRSKDTTKGPTVNEHTHFLLKLSTTRLRTALPHLPTRTRELTETRWTCFNTSLLFDM